MDIDIYTLLIAVILLLFTLLTRKSVFKNKDIEYAIHPIVAGTSTILTFFIVSFIYKKIGCTIIKILNSIFSYNVNTSGIADIILISVLFIIIKFIIEYTLDLLIQHRLKDIITCINNRKILNVFSIILGFVRGYIFIVLIFMSLSIYNTLTFPDTKIEFLYTNKVYTGVNQIMHKSHITCISSCIQKKIISTISTHYNGITIDEGIQSNDAIKLKAEEITEGMNSDKSKALTIYTWIGLNISYDNEKAEMISNRYENIESGAITAFNSRKGICLDYACLYTAMAKSIGLKTRIIIGEAYNGQEYVSHSWNQVYIPNEDLWINLDSTFYSAGNYFNSDKFETQHKIKTIAGEF